MCIRDRVWVYNRSQNRVGLFDIGAGLLTWASRSLAELFGSLDYQANGGIAALFEKDTGRLWVCLLYTSDAADERYSVDLGGRRVIKKKKK